MTAPGDGAPANSLRRGFLAVVPPPEVLDAVERRAAPVRNMRVGPRWTTRDQWHLTVQFLGAVPDVDLLGKAVADAVRELEPFAVQVGGGGGFPSERRCRVLWLGIRERTVNWHLGRIFVKLRAGSRAEAVAIAMEEGIVRRPHDTRTSP